MKELKPIIKNRISMLTRRDVIKRTIIGSSVAIGSGLLGRFGLPDLLASRNAMYAIEDITNTLEIQRCRVGFCLIAMETGRVVYSFAADEPFTIGSNRKLFLAAAALLTLGEQYKISTSIHTLKKAQQGILHGSLFIKGGGDPLLANASLEYLASQVAASGIKHITGSIVGDGTVFTPLRRYGADSDPSDFPERQSPGFYAQQLMGQVAGLSVNRGVRNVFVAPAESCDLPAVVSVDGGFGPFVLDNRARTTSTGTSCRIFRQPGTKTLKVEGGVAMSEVALGIAAIPDPAMDVAERLRIHLLNLGVSVGGKAVTGIIDPLARVNIPLAIHQGISLRSYIASMNKTSDSLLAESLNRVIGEHTEGKGSTGSGCSQESKVLRREGIKIQRTQFVDGSGIDPSNKSSPQDICHLLYRFANYPDTKIRSAFIDSLAIAGKDGTLSQRLLAKETVGHVRAKTATLNGVHGLSGYLEGSSGRKYAFSLIVNGADSTKDSQVRKAIDRAIGHISAS